MASHTQSVKVNPVAFIANQASMKIAAPTSFVTNLGAGLDTTSRGLGNIATIKSELKASLEQTGNTAEQSASSGIGGFAMNAALTGISFVSGPVGAVAGVIGAVTSLGASTPKHFGLKGVQGGELAQGVQSQDTPSGGYVDVMGDTWGSKGEPIQVSRTVAPATPAPQGKLGSAIGAAHEMFSRDQLEAALYTMGEQEKALNVAHNGMVRRAKEAGGQVKFTGGVEDYNAFNDSPNVVQRPKVIAPQYGMQGMGGMSAPAGPSGPGGFA